MFSVLPASLQVLLSLCNESCLKLKILKSTRGEAYLYAHLGQVHFHGEFLSAVHVGVMWFLESSLQLVKLVRGEGRAVTPMFFLTRVTAASASTTISWGGGHTVRYSRARSFVLTAALVVMLTTNVWQTVVRITVFTCQM